MALDTPIAKLMPDNWQENYAYSIDERDRMIAEYEKHYDEVKVVFSKKNGGVYIVRFRGPKS